MENRTDILLVSSPGPSPLKEMINRAVGTLPVGLAHIGAALIENGYKVIGLDLFNNRDAVPSFKELLIQHKPRMVGFSAATETYNNAIRLAKLCKKIDENVIIVIGGPHVTFTAEETLKEKAIDIVVRGEGESTITELAGYYFKGYGSLDRIKGISYRINENIINNKPRPLIQNLDELPFLQRSIFPFRYSIPANILSSRGCPAKCIFCAAAAMAGGKYRTRTAESVIDEIVYILKINVGNKIKFLDDTVTADLKRLKKLLNYIEVMDIKILWGAESRVDVITEEALEMMGKFGCVSIQFGVESGSQKILNNIRKGIKLEQVIRAVEWASKSMTHICCSFIVGLPDDTEETIKETLDFGLNLQNKYNVEVLFSIATPYPGTKLFDHSEELGLRMTTFNYDNYNFLNPVFDTKHLTIQQMRNLQFEIMQEVMRTMPQEVREYYMMQKDIWKLESITQ